MVSLNLRNPLIFKRSIYISKDISKGELFSKQNIKIVRPNLGLHPKYYKLIFRKKRQKNLFKANPLRLSEIKK